MAKRRNAARGGGVRAVPAGAVMPWSGSALELVRLPFPARPGLVADPRLAGVGLGRLSALLAADGTLPALAEAPESFEAGAEGGRRWPVSVCVLDPSAEELHAGLTALEEGMGGGVTVTGRSRVVPLADEAFNHVVGRVDPHDDESLRRGLTGWGALLLPEPFSKEDYLLSRGEGYREFWAGRLGVRDAPGWSGEPEGERALLALLDLAARVVDSSDGHGAGGPDWSGALTVPWEDARDALVLSEYARLVAGGGRGATVSCREASLSALGLQRAFAALVAFDVSDGEPGAFVGALCYAAVLGRLADIAGSAALDRGAVARAKEAAGGGFSALAELDIEGWDVGYLMGELADHGAFGPSAALAEEVVWLLRERGADAASGAARTAAERSAALVQAHLHLTHPRQPLVRLGAMPARAAGGLSVTLGAHSARAWAEAFAPEWLGDELEEGTLGSAVCRQFLDVLGSDYAWKRCAHKPCGRWFKAKLTGWPKLRRANRNALYCCEEHKDAASHQLRTREAALVQKETRCAVDQMRAAAGGALGLRASSWGPGDRLALRERVVPSVMRSLMEEGLVDGGRDEAARLARHKVEEDVGKMVDERIEEGSMWDYGRPARVRGRG